MLIDALMKQLLSSLGNESQEQLKLQNDTLTVLLCLMSDSAQWLQLPFQPFIDIFAESPSKSTPTKIHSSPQFMANSPYSNPTSSPVTPLGQLKPTSSPQGILSSPQPKYNKKAQLRGTN